MRKTSKFKTVLLWIGRLLLGASAVTLVIGTVFAIETVTFVLRAKHATGSITRLDEQISDHGAVNYAPVFTFTASDSKQYTVRSIVATNPPGFDVGESADVLYVPSNPSGEHIATFWQLWFVCVVLGFIGVVNGFIGGCLTLLARRQRKADAVPQ